MQQLRQNKIFLFLFLLILLMTVSMALPLTTFAGEGADQTVKIYYRNANNPMAVIEVTDSKGITQSFDGLKTTPGSYLSASLSLGECQYKVYKDAAKSTVAGSGSFAVTSTTSELYLCYMRVDVSYQLSEEEWPDYKPGGSVTVIDAEKNPLTPGNISFSSDGRTEYHEYVAVASELSTTYSYEIQPNDNKIDKGDGTISFTKPTSLQWGLTNGAKALTPLKNSADFFVTKGAPFDLYSKGKAHYTPFTKYEPTKIDKSSDVSYDIYKYENNLPRKNFHYIAGGGNSGFQEQGRYISGGDMDKKTFHVDLDTLDNNKREDLGYLEDNLYLNMPDSKYKSLEIGDSFKLEAFRVWQAVTDITSNYFIEPDFHYEVIGDSVERTSGGSPGREYETVTGLKKGISIIKITYDAMDWKEQYVTGDTTAVHNNYYNAIDPVNTGIVVINVGGNNDANIKMNIGQTEYDTIYYASSINGVEQDKQYAEYTFTPTADEELAVRVHDPLNNTEWGKAWTSYEPNQDGSYTVHLKEGRNIIEVSAGDSVQYYVVNAKGVQITIENETDPGKSFKVGDTVKLSFKGLSQPLQKMAGIYNPGWPGTCWVQYETKKGRVIQSEGTQYDLIVNNDIEFILTEEGTMNLVNGCIHAGHMGSPLGTHRNIPEAGMLPNLDASNGSNSPYFSKLPEISIQVEDGQTDEKLNQLTSAQLSNLKAKLGDNEVSWNVSSTSMEELNSIRNKVQKWEVGGGSLPLSVIPTALNDDVTISARYFLQSDDEKVWKKIEGLTSGSQKQIIDSLDEDDVAYVEITVNPAYNSKGYIQTYTIRVSNNVSAKNDYPYLTNLKLSAVNGQADMETLDGQLRAVTGEDLDLGYGFLMTRKNFTTHVPYAVDKITLTATQGKADGLMINGEAAEEKKPSAEIELTAGENEIPIVCSYDGKEVIYTVSVIRDMEPKKIQFSAESGSQLILKKDSGKTLEPETDGSYMLSEGTYTYYYSKTGYLTKTGTVVIKADTTTVSLPALEKAEQTFGDVSVRAMAQDRILRDKTTISFTEDTLKEAEHDLEVQGYVSNNYGGYTALHALIDAFNTGVSKVDFTCYKGVLTPKVDVNKTGLGSNAGWVCEVNGKVCDPATTLVNDGDQVDLYYNSDYSTNMRHTWFEDNILSVTAGDSAEVTLLSTPVRNSGTAAAGVEGAEIKVNGTAVGTTDASGKLVIPTDKISDPNQYTITAEKLENGKNILTYAYAILTVKKADTTTEPGKMTVKFRLIGDAKHKDGTDGHGKYVTWIATKKMSFNAKSVTVYDVFTKALDQAGLEYVGAENNYVRSIVAPKAYGGYKLAEFTNGQNSGWMYTVNGIHPDFGLKDYSVTNGDVIIWHYVDDYKLETSFEGSVATYPNRWMQADDVDPPSDGSVIDMSKGNGGSTIGEKTKTANATVSTEAKVDSNGKATASIDKKAVTEAIKNVKDAAAAAEKSDDGKVSKKVVLEVTGTEKANTLETILPKESAKELNESVDIVNLKTTMGEVRFDKDSFAALAKAMDGDIKLTITKKSAADLGTVSEANQKKLENRPIVDFKAEAGSKAVTQFDGILTISIPYEKSSEEQEDALILYKVAENGDLSIIPSSKYTNGYMVIQTKQLGSYAIGYNEAKFADTASHWAKKNILYLAARDILKGKSAAAFEPDSQITRAEFAQILANMSGADLSTYSVSKFKDVSEAAWYAKAVAWTAENGIAGGTGNGQFSPNANITRQDMSVMITKYAENIAKEALSEANTATKFADYYDIADYAWDAVTAMQKAGILNGEKNNLGSYSFYPKNNATRAEAATMIAKYINQ